MMAVGTRLREVAEESEAPPQPNPASVQLDAAAVQRMNAATQMLFTGLKALSQRAVVAFASLVDLMLIASVFVLALQIIGAPTTPQLIGGAGYSLFILCAIGLRRRHAGIP
jgi:hypothetical protein